MPSVLPAIHVSGTNACVEWVTELGLWRVPIDLCPLSAFEVVIADGSREKLDELVISFSKYIQNDSKVLSHAFW